MQNRYAVTKASIKLPRHCRSEGNFRHQEKSAASAGQRRIDGIQINFRLPGTRNSMHQKSAELATADTCFDQIQSLPLGRIQFMWCALWRRRYGEWLSCQGD